MVESAMHSLSFQALAQGFVRERFQAAERHVFVTLASRTIGHVATMRFVYHHKLAQWDASLSSMLLHHLPQLFIADVPRQKAAASPALFQRRSKKSGSWPRKETTIASSRWP
jgi:hypothetical protein